MPYVLLHFGSLFAGNREESEEFILFVLRLIAWLDRKYLERHPETPKLYDSGVLYALPDQLAECRIDPGRLRDCERFLRRAGASEETVAIVGAVLRGIEIFRDIPQIIARGSMDCDGLMTFRCAELLVAGVAAEPMINWPEGFGGTTYHALVRHPDGTSEDPSILLGMGGEKKAAEREEERRKNRERFDTFVEAARALCFAGQMSPDEATRKIDALGLLPKSGVWAYPETTREAA